MTNEIFKRAPHNPPHLFLPNALYMLTASIYQRVPLIESPERKREWIVAFQKAAEIHGWQIIAWVVLHDHYHAIVQSPEKAETLPEFISSFHKFTARKWNDKDKLNGRKVWWNYWDTCIGAEPEYYHRLRYIFWNPVKHGLVEDPKKYLFSNYKDFLLSWQVDFNFTDMDEVTDEPEF